MAAGNWSHFDVSTDDKWIKGKDGCSIDMYKNWLVINDGGHIGEINVGEMSYKDVRVEAIRGPQDGIYCVIEAGYDPTKILIGCGVYGYDPDVELAFGEDPSLAWVGVTADSMKFLRDWINTHTVHTREEAIAEMTRLLGWDQGSAHSPAEEYVPCEEGIKNYMEPTYKFSKEVRDLMATVEE